MKKTKKLKEKALAKEKGKGKNWKTKRPRKQLDTIVNHPNKPYYCGSGLLMDYPLEKLFE